MYMLFSDEFSEKTVKSGIIVNFYMQYCFVIIYCSYIQNRGCL